MSPSRSIVFSIVWKMKNLTLDDFEFNEVANGHVRTCVTRRYDIPDSSPLAFHNKARRCASSKAPHWFGQRVCVLSVRVGFCRMCCCSAGGVLLQVVFVRGNQRGPEVPRAGGCHLPQIRHRPWWGLGCARHATTTTTTTTKTIIVIVVIDGNRPPSPTATVGGNRWYCACQRHSALHSLATLHCFHACLLTHIRTFLPTTIFFFFCQCDEIRTRASLSRLHVWQLLLDNFQFRPRSYMTAFVIIEKCEHQKSFF